MLMALQLLYDHFLNFQDNKSAIVNFSVRAGYVISVPLKLLKNTSVVNSLRYRPIW